MDNKAFQDFIRDTTKMVPEYEPTQEDWDDYNNYGKGL